MFNIWKKLDPDAIWTAPALILMSIQSAIVGKGYVNQDLELNMIYIALVLLFIGSAVGLLKPIKRRIERGIIVEDDAQNTKKHML
jgi:hypothetical protein